MFSFDSFQVFLNLSLKVFDKFVELFKGKKHRISNECLAYSKIFS